MTSLYNVNHQSDIHQSDDKKSSSTIDKPYNQPYCNITGVDELGKTCLFENFEYLGDLLVQVWHRSIIEKKLAYARERGDRQATGIYLAEVGETLCHLGHYSAAEVHFWQALIYIQDSLPYQYAIRLCVLGQVLLVQDRNSESYGIFQESFSGMKIGEKWGQGKALAGLSIATFKMGEREKGWEIIQQALLYHHEGHSHYFTHFSLAAYAYLLSQQGDPLAGIKIYAMLDEQKFIRESHWFKNLYRDPIYASALRDNPDEIKKAESIGKEMNLWKALEQIVQQSKM